MTAGVWRGKKLLQHRLFDHDEIGVKAFEAFLQQHSKATLYLICNVNEEDYQRHLLPHSSGRTQKNLLARKLSQTYRGLMFSVAMPQGREQSASKKDIYLFAAIRHDQCLQPWLEMLQKTNHVIAGAYLLPMVTEQLLLSGIVATQPTEHLLICERLSLGLHQAYLRHSYFHHGHLRMSRLLTHVPGLTHVPSLQDAWSNVHHTETEKSRLHLISQRFLEADANLHVMLLDHETDHKTGHGHFEKLAKQLRLPLPALIQTPELAHMQLLINDAVLANLANLAPRTLTQKFHEQRTMLQISALTFSVLLLCAVFGVYFLQEGERLATETVLLHTQLTHAKQGYDKLRQQSHALTAKAVHIKNAVTLATQIDALPASPLSMMQVLSASFTKMTDAASAITLQSLDWSLNSAETEVVTSYENALISLETSSEKNLQSYMSHLRQHPQVTSVEILSSPPSTPESSAQPTLQGSTAPDENASVSMQSYQLSVTLKPQQDERPR
jgi:hypothetical protein